jgi:hypothetical protein
MAWAEQTSGHRLDFRLGHAKELSNSAARHGLNDAES